MAKPNLGATKLNIGCGPDLRDGWENIDLWEYNPTVVPIDLELAKFPYRDDSIEEIRATHVLEHVHNYPYLLNECHRVLQPEGTMYIEVPQFPYADAVKDPTHVRFFVPETFKYFSEYLEIGLFKMYQFKPWKIMSMKVTDNNLQIYVTMKPIK